MRDKDTDTMNMEGVYIDKQGVWHKARIDGTREFLELDRKISGAGESAAKDSNNSRPAPPEIKGPPHVPPVK